MHHIISLLIRAITKNLFIGSFFDGLTVMHSGMQNPCSRSTSGSLFSETSIGRYPFNPSAPFHITCTSTIDLTVKIYAHLHFPLIFFYCNWLNLNFRIFLKLLLQMLHVLEMVLQKFCINFRFISANSAISARSTVVFVTSGHRHTIFC